MEIKMVTKIKNKINDKYVEKDKYEYFDTDEEKKC